MKVSFDFDSTLTVDTVKDLAKTLVEEEHEVWIVTSRHEIQDLSGNKVNNDDLFEIVNEIGIKKECIKFTCGKNKSEFLKDKGFLWHLDDDIIELSFIRTNTNVFPIWRWHGNDWKNQCKDLIRILK